MKILSGEFVTSIATGGSLPPSERAVVALVGRSNVGKSSLINTLVKRRVARAGTAPGVTRLLNVYRVCLSAGSRGTKSLTLVDLPGYGYARAPKHMRDAWAKLIDWYLTEPECVKGLVHLVDARRKPTKHDLEMVLYLSKLGIPAIVVLTKMDKLKKNQCLLAVQRACEELGIEEEQVVPFSSRTGEGREALLEALADLVTEAEAA